MQLDLLFSFKGEHSLEALWAHVYCLCLTKHYACASFAEGINNCKRCDEIQLKFSRLHTIVEIECHEKFVSLYWVY